MDFLDPRKQRNYRIQLIAGYVLIGITIGLATRLLVNFAYGYGINTKTGGVVAHGLLFVDSTPSGATINLTGTETHNDKTSARLVLQAGQYNLKLTKSGYRSWQRPFTLEGSTVERFVYPFLFPQKPVVSSLPNASYTSQSPLTTQSPDHHWLLVQQPVGSSGAFIFDEFDTTKLDQAPVPITVPAGILTIPAPSDTLTEVEWSTDNNHLLLQHKYQTGSEFIVFNRDDPASSFNVNRTFKIAPSQVALRNNKVDQLYLYDQADQTLQVGVTGTAELDPVFLRHVLAFKAYGNDLMTYVTAYQQPSGMAQARIWNNGQTYALYSFTAGQHYLIDAAQFQNHWYYVAGSDTDNRVDIFEDPLSKIQDSSVGKAVPVLALRVLGGTKVSFSDNTRFVEVEAGQTFGVYDFEQQERYQYTLKAPLTAPMQWMDGHRLIGQSGTTALVMDYDSTNQQLLTPSLLSVGGYFSDDYHHMFTETATEGGAVELKAVDMRAGSDLPKDPLTN